MPTIDEMVTSQTEGAVSAEVAQGPGTTRVTVPMRESGSETPAKADTKPAEKPASTEIEPMPEGGVAKFYDSKTGNYNWQAHAVEAEFRAKQAKGKPAKAPAPSEEGEGEARDIVANAGLDFDTLGDKIAQFGDIDADDYETLERAGIPQHIVQAHIAGLKAMQENTQSAVLKKVDGKENLDRLMAWAGSALTPAEIKGYNEMLSSPQWPVALDMLMARAGGHQAPQMLRPGSNEPVQTGGFGDHNEFMDALRDPRYKTSAAYRQEVVNKLARTPRGNAQARGRVRI